MNAWEFISYEEIMALKKSGAITEQDAIDFMDAQMLLEQYQLTDEEKEYEKYLKSLGLYSYTVDLEDYTNTNMTNEIYKDLAKRHSDNVKAIQEKHEESARLYAQQEQIRLEMEHKHQERQALEAEHAALQRKLQAWKDETLREQQEAAKQAKIKLEEEQKIKEAELLAQKLKALNDAANLRAIQDAANHYLLPDTDVDEIEISDVDMEEPGHYPTIQQRAAAITQTVKRKKASKASTAQANPKQIKSRDSALYYHPEDADELIDNVLFGVDGVPVTQSSVVPKNTLYQKERNQNLIIKPNANTIWNITTGTKGDLKIIHVPSGRVFLKITEEEIIIGDEQGEYIRLGGESPGAATNAQQSP
jgi:hypothetical protein